MQRLKRLAISLLYLTALAGLGTVAVGCATSPMLFGMKRLEDKKDKPAVEETAPQPEPQPADGAGAAATGG